jgi:hypothetical protein
MPNPILTAQTIRTAFDVSEWDSGVVPKDLTTGSPMVLAVGADLLWQMILFDAAGGALADGNILAVTNLASVVIALQTASNPHNGINYWSETVSVANILAPGSGSPALTTANWVNGTQQQISLAIPNTIWNTLSMSGESAFWVLMYGVTTDVPAKIVPFTGFQATIFDTGLPITNPLSSPSVVGYTSFLCPDGYYRREKLVLDPSGSGDYVSVVDQTPRTSP